MKRSTAWERWDREVGNSHHLLPPDLTRGFAPWRGRGCGASWHAWLCTRIPLHTGRHAAGTGQHIVAVWP